MQPAALAVLPHIDAVLLLSSGYSGSQHQTASKLRAETRPVSLQPSRDPCLTYTAVIPSTVNPL